MIAVAILASGEAKRAGGPKLTWPIDGVPSVRRVAEASLKAKMINETIVITGGPWAEKISMTLQALPLTIIHNPNYANGQSSSLKVALSHLGNNFSNLMFILADQPFINSKLIDDLVKSHLEKKADISAPFAAGKRRNPVIFNLNRFRDELMRLEGDKGGREVVKNNIDKLNLWPADSYSLKCFDDFDTIEEYERIKTR